MTKRSRRTAVEAASSTKRSLAHCAIRLRDTARRSRSRTNARRAAISASCAAVSGPSMSMPVTVNRAATSAPPANGSKTAAMKARRSASVAVQRPSMRSRARASSSGSASSGRRGSRRVSVVRGSSPCGRCSSVAVARRPRNSSRPRVIVSSRSPSGESGAAVRR